MSSLSWRLFRALNIYRPHPIMEHPVFRREQRRQFPQWRITLHDGLNRGAAALLVLGLLALLLFNGIACSALLCCLGPIMLAVLFLPLWTLPLSLALAPVIVQERTRGTWDLLRVTLADTDALIVAKMRSALEALRPLLNFLVGALLLTGLGLGLAFANQALTWAGLQDAYPYEAHTALPGSVRFVIGLAFGAVGLLLYLADRIQQVMCIGVAALAAGTSTQRAGRGAVIFAVATAFGVWLLELVFVIVILRVGAADVTYFGLGIWVIMGIGPMPGYMVLAGWPWSMLAAFAVSFGVRELALRGLWRWTLHTAQQ